MNPVDHPNTTRRFGAPADWTPERDGACGTLSIADVEGAGGLFMESLWRPTPEELAALQAGGAVVLGIRGVVHPVVYVSVTAREHVEPGRREGGA